MVHAKDAATPETAERFGICEPRLCTPPLRPLTRETSLGFDVIDFADEVLGVTLLPWQRAALIRLLELLPDGSLRFRTVLILVARQNGKSTLAQVLTIWLMCVWGWPVALGTAQDLDVAESLWEEVVDMVESNPDLAPMISKIVKVNGKKSLNLLREVGDGTATVHKYRVKAANRRAGRGLSGNLILLDELREHQTWDAWGAITKTTMARLEALILCLSNAGDATSRVLRHLRMIAHEALGDPDGIVKASAGDTAKPTQFDAESVDLDLALPDDDEDDDEDLDDDELDGLDAEDLQQDADTLCLLEWSAPPGTGWTPVPKTAKERTRRVAQHRPAWRQANPSMGHTALSIRTIAAASRTDPEWTFRTEVLCQWLDGATTGPFPPGSWEATTVDLVPDDQGREVVAEVDRIVGRVVACVAQSTDRSFAFVALAGYRADGLAQVELAAGRYGTDWVRDWLLSPDRHGRITAVTAQAKGAPESTLLHEFEGDPEFTARLPVMPLSGADLLDAHAIAFDQVRDGLVRHTPQPVLDLPAQTAATKTLGGGPWVVDAGNSPIDVAPLRAFIGALWLLGTRVPDPPPPPPPPAAVRTAELRSESTGGGTDLTGDLASIGF